MTTDPQAPVVPLSPPPGWLQRLRANLDEHMFFWIMLLLALYVFFGVPQVTNVWQQRPPLEGSVAAMAGYVAFLSFLIAFYALSMFVVMRRFPAQWVQDRVETFVSQRVGRWREQGRRRFYRPTYWLAVVTWRAPDLCCRWLVWTVSNPERRTTVPKAALVLLVLVLAGSTGLLLGTSSDASRAYPLAGAFCQYMAVLSLAAAVWLLAAIRLYRRGAERPGEVWLHFGRFIAWQFSTALIGEILWVLAHTGWWDNLISYRFYTIWAVFQMLTGLVIVGLLIDRWHASTDRWPVRQVALLLLPVVVWLFSRSLPVSTADLERHLTPDQIEDWRTLCKGNKGPDTADWHARSNGPWFSHLNRLVQAVPDSQPVVIVAASGGGSRAAIFTALVLETLARTPTTRDPSTREFAAILHAADGPRGRTWADNVVLISSVSGGSLATADHVARRKPQTLPESVRGLLNTLPMELRHWGVVYARELIKTYLDGRPEGFAEEVFQDYYRKEERSKVDPQVAVTALQKAEPDLKEQREKLRKERKEKEAELKLAKLALRQGLPPAEAEKLAQQVEKLAHAIAQQTETAVALATALALLEGHRSLEEDSTASLGRWIWTSRAFDEMCVDFMAPLTRGALTPALDRGDALARFWTHRFDWSNCTNFSGYHGPVTRWNYGPERPAVVFNAVDVARGSRLAVGFPPLPSDLWDAVYQRGLTREVPRALNAPVSLARAVRMSSNFPYGFRAMEFQVPTAAAKPGGGQPQPDPIHVLDGGVVDNTGLDTIYELLQALEYHADPKHSTPEKPNPYQADAAALLANLRRHGVCLLEIDAGAKPDTELPRWFHLLGGVKEQSQALENGGYSNADRAKQLYLKEIRRILTQRLQDPARPLREGKTSLRDLEDSLPPTVLHYCFQCNHYRPGHGADPAIMTAWALGPRDKAEVVARSLPELELWDRRRTQLWDDIKQSKEAVERARQVARVRVLADRVADLNRSFRRHSIALENFEELALAGKPVAPAEFADVRRHFGEDKGRLAALVPDIQGEENKELRAAWAELDGQVNQDEQRLALLDKARQANQWAQVKTELQREPNRARQARESYRQVREHLQFVEVGVPEAVAAERTSGKLLDPQLRYDQDNRQKRDAYEKRPAMNR